MAFKKRPPAQRRRFKKRTTRPRKSTRLSVSRVRSIALSAVQKGREIKRTWGAIASDSEGNLVNVPTGSMVPYFNFSEGNDYYTEQCLNATRQGLESEMRIGNAIQPISFNLKGYGVIGNEMSTNAFSYNSHIRVVCGFRRQNTPLTISNTKLMIEAGKMVSLSNTYKDVLNSFNWKEFRPFYDKTFLINPGTSNANNAQNFCNPFIKNYFHFNINHKFPRNAKNLETFESSDGTNINLYNNKNIYVLFLCRQMNNDNTEVGTNPCEIYATCSLAFHDA